MSIQDDKEVYSQLKRELESSESLLAERHLVVEEQIQQLEEAFKVSNAELIDQIGNVKERTVELENTLRKAAIDHYELTDYKSLDENLSVQVRRKYDYRIEDAVEWARVNAPVLIKESIDKKSFEAFPGTNDLDFVVINENVISVIKGL